MMTTMIKQNDDDDHYNDIINDNYGNDVNYNMIDGNRNDDDDDDDSVLEEIDVYLSSSLLFASQLLATTTSSTNNDENDNNSKKGSLNPSKFYLMQYPGHWNDLSSSSCSNNILVDKNHTYDNDNIKDNTNDSKIMEPIAVRIKPRHHIIEADHMVHYNSNSNSSINNNDPTASTVLRTYTSQTIPINTHLCVGRFITNQDDNKKRNNTSSLVNTASTTPASTTPTTCSTCSRELHLIPITNLTQMRPSFQHILTSASASSMLLNENDFNDNNNDTEMDIVDQNDDDIMNDIAGTNTFNQFAIPQPTTSSSSPSLILQQQQEQITYQRKESDRAIAIRKSSFAYQKLSQDNEMYIPLAVIQHSHQTSSNIFYHRNNDTPTPSHRHHHRSNCNKSTNNIKNSTNNINNRLREEPKHNNIYNKHQISFIQSLNYINANNNSKVPYSYPNSNVPVTTVTTPTTDITTGNSMIAKNKWTVQRVISILQINHGGPLPFSILLLSIMTNNNNSYNINTYNYDSHPSTNNIITNQQNQHYNEQLLLSILNTVAVLVRGNWYLHSKYMKFHSFIPKQIQQQSLIHNTSILASTTTSTVPVVVPSISVGYNINNNNNNNIHYDIKYNYRKLQQRIRTFALLLLNEYGKIYKQQFINAYMAIHNQYNTSDSNPIQQKGVDSTTDIIVVSILTRTLELTAKSTKYGYWVGSMEDDLHFIQYYPTIVQLHNDNYWSIQQKKNRFWNELQFYQQLVSDREANIQ